MSLDIELFGMNGLKLFISKEHRFGTDSLLLADFAKRAASGKTVCDLCSGCGVIPIAVCADNPAPPKKIYAVERQSDAAALLRWTVHENNLGFIEIIEGDLRDRSVMSAIKRESVDLVTANPPYYTDNSGYERDSREQKAARYEKNCAIADVVVTAKELLKFGGELRMCMTATRFAETASVMREAGIEPKEAVFVMKTNGTARIFLVSGKKGANPGITIKTKGG